MGPAGMQGQVGANTGGGPSGGVPNSPILSPGSTPIPGTQQQGP